MFDVVIVGAGPAGAVAATQLARAGARVLLVDRARFPRPKLCGDTLNPGAFRVLRRAGLVEAAPPRSLPLYGMRVTVEARVWVEGRYPNGISGLVIRREDLDATLVGAAVRAGACFEAGVAVRNVVIETNGRGPEIHGVLLAGGNGRTVHVPARVTIAADGRHSRIAFALGLARHPRRPRRWAIGAYFEGVVGRSGFGEMHIRRGRYIGVAPLPADLVNVCLVTGADRGLRDPMALLVATLSGDSALADRFASARPVGPARVVGPLAVDVRAAGMPGLLLAGDSAGFIDPMTGDGLYFAVRGGELAAETALEMLDQGCRDGGPRLGARRRREFAAKCRLNRLLRAIVGSGTGVALGGVAAALAPQIVRRLIMAAADIT